MATKNIQLTGGKAVIALIAVVAFVGFRWITAQEALATEGRELLTQSIALEFQRDVLAQDDLSLAEQGAELLEANEVAIESMKARGRLDDLIVRVTLEEGPHLPPDEDRVRYYRLEYSSLTGWRFRRRVSALQYYLKLI